MANANANANAVKTRIAIDYKTCWGINCADLAANVKSNLPAWEPIGGAFHGIELINNVLVRVHYQALVKYDYV